MLKKIILILFVLNASFYSFSQTQIGNDLDGTGLNSWFGNAIELSENGRRLVAGAPVHTGIAEATGLVKVYELENGNWNQIGSDLEGTERDGFFGFSVAITNDGNRIAVGNPLVGMNSGLTRIFDWNNEDWVQVGEDIPSLDSGANGWEDRSGWAVALSREGDKIAIGSQTDNNGDGSTAIYQWINNTWTLMGSKILGEGSGDEAGGAVSLSASGNRVAIGAINNDGNGIDAGHVRIFDWDGVAWNQVGEDIDGETNNDKSGRSVSLTGDGNRILIGAPENDGNGNRASHCRIFDWDGNQWTQVGTDIDAEAAEDQMGIAVSIAADGLTFAVGALRNDGSEMDAGQTRIYKWDNLNWTQVGMDIDGENAFDRSGIAVALSGDGNTVAIGSTDNDDSFNTAGHVRVYELNELTGTDFLAETSFNVFPNPTFGTLQIQGDQSIDYLALIDLQGQLILNKKGAVENLDLSSIPSGIYFLKIRVGSKFLVKKVIIK